eukprot:TRINITY_DN8316_c0_g2_i1.p1 TRINITY_DN8316_c0_g2~~TRINITY_DN8316_c0_g2_i1.p1  ORF type:complete len:181 (-),score=26.10 TRINITY_DN8316_c0_g2_i1:271-813(-)
MAFAGIRADCCLAAIAHPASATAFALPATRLGNKKKFSWLSASHQHTRKRLFASNAPSKHVGTSVVCRVSSVGQNDFEEKVLNSDLPVLVDFVADWCGPCKLIGPFIDWASQEYQGKLNVYKVDHDANPQVVEKYKVYGLPTLILFKDGKEIPGSRREGAITKEKLKVYLDQFLETSMRH